MNTIISELSDSRELVVPIMMRKRTAKKTIDSSLSETIKRTRNRLNLTQKQFGILLGCTATAVNRWERSVSNPEGTLLKKVEAVIGEVTIFETMLSCDNGLELAAAVVAMYVNLHKSNIQETIRTMKAALACVS